MATGFGYGPGTPVCCPIFDSPVSRFGIGRNPERRPAWLIGRQELQFGVVFLPERARCAMGINPEGLAVDGIAPNDHANDLLPRPPLNGKTQPRSLITTALIYTEIIQIKLHSRECRNAVE